MAPKNLEVVRSALEANHSGPPEETVEMAVSLSHPEIELHSRLMAVEGDSYRGHEGMRRYFADLADAWQEWHNKVQDMREVSPNAVFGHILFRGVGRESGASVELPSAVVCVLEDELLREIHVHATDEEALAAAGLP